MSISSSSMLVELNMSVWSAKKLDRSATRDLIHDNDATNDAAQVHKNLMAGTSLRKEIADFVTNCRAWHHYNTVPWLDRGPRLLRTSLFLDYKAEANKRQDKFMSLVDKICDFYPGWLDEQVQGHQHRNLGRLFDIADYPSVEELRGKFGFKLTFSPLPESGDFRLDIPRQELEDMRKEYDEAFSTRLADAMREPWERLHEVLSAMSAKLDDGDGESEKKKRYHETLVTNATSLCSVLTHLNVTDDPVLEKARQEVEKMMTGVTIDDIRDSPTFRTGLKSKVDTLLGGYDW